RISSTCYLAVWRHIGFSLGVAPTSLAEHFVHPVVADQFLLSATIHLFLNDEELEKKNIP
ncbi:hypothetical protein DFH05DRAFT_1376553, partial [Lentinula detonsa]